MTPFDVVKQRMQLGYYRNVPHCVKSVLKVEGINAFFRSLPTTLMMNMPYGCVMVATNESAKKVLNPSGRYSLFSCLTAGCIAGGVAAALTNPLDVIKTRLQTQDLQPLAKTINSQTSKKGSTFSMSRTNAHLLGNQYGVPTAHISPYTTKAKTPLSVPLCETPNIFSSNTVNVATPRYFGMLQTAKLLYIEGGVAGFFRGVGARVMIHAPSVAISWTTYETVKHFFAS